MVYLRNRYYKINEGRFTQVDPAKDGLNWYAYCGNNPVNFVDPFGLDPDNYVMVKYSVEKIGGKVVGFDNDRKIAYIEYNGMTVGYQTDRVITLLDDNGDLVARAITNVDSLYEFLHSMGYSGSPDYLLHNPGDSFNSLNEAAYAWALRYNKWSIVNIKIDSGKPGYEMTSYIYLDKQRGTYYFSEPMRNPTGTGKNVDIYIDNTAIGVIHSHGADSNGKYIDYEFSYEDIKSFPGKSKYLVTPSGQLLYREPDAKADYAGGQGGFVVVGTGAGIYPN